MTTLSHIIDAPQLDEVIDELARETKDVTRRRVRAYDVKLYPDDTAVLGSGPHMQVSGAALADLGRMVKVPSDYFLTTCDSRLRAVTFNYLLKTAGSEHPAFVAEIAAGMLTSISPTCLIPVPRLGILQCLRASVPASVDAAAVKVIKHQWDGVLDISAISEALTCEPRLGDAVAFGVSVAADTKGAIRVQAASYRLFCKNGAVNRVCDSDDRRPMFHTNRDDDYFKRITALASGAWQQWEENAASIQHLPAVPIYEERFPELRSTLRNPPFFLSAGLADQVLSRLQTEARMNAAAPTAFDLWNALTYVGTHEEGVSHAMSYRLRRGAGELSHHASRTCSACHQLVIA